ncbi:unnamed protein product [Ceutorhynchus assimilis]|uniref:GH18 domain-containing protein n=1 Tax=Ceutorhynchus assimilis TaxID=467358 RepID=A0A9N9MP63_9CUCU|nr:unnamed protein product [Ceutorhynchus assimilis]
MFSEEHNRYVLLQRDIRNPWLCDKKTVALLGCLMLPVTFFCATYVILFGICDELGYPRPQFDGFNAIEILERNQLRAELYSNTHAHGNYSEIPEEIPKDIHIHHADYTPEKLKLICYYNFPSNDFSLKINEIDPNLCTHLNLAFASVVNHSIYLDEEHLGYLTNIIPLKEKNQYLKILLSIGGAGNNNGYPEMVKNHTNRKTFIQSVLNYVKDYKIDGVDLDWEFPGENSADHYQKMHFTQLLSEIRKTINKQPKYKFLLTVAVAAPNEIIDVAYDVSYMNEYVDFINLMSYDYHYYTKITPFTGINSPLYQASNEKFYLSTLNINYSSHYWNYLGMDKSKIVVGLPTYGHTFKLTNSENHGLYAPALGFGHLGSLGFASYSTICTFLQGNHISPIFDMDTFSPYAVKYYEWISFDDQQSLTYKAEYIKSNNFGGAMVYSLNADDYKGDCDMGTSSGIKFPLITAIKNVFDG